MESGLEDRNNIPSALPPMRTSEVSMESGLEDRNNRFLTNRTGVNLLSLNGVRPRRPEQ